MLIENVEIHVRSITEIYQTKEEIQKKNEKQMKDSFDSKSDQNRELDTETHKKVNLRLWEEGVRLNFDKFVAPGWIQQIIEKIMQNMHFTIKNFIIYFESNLLLSQESQLEIRFEQLSISALNEFDEDKFNNNSNFLNYLVKLQKFCVLLDI